MEYLFAFLAIIAFVIISIILYLFKRKNNSKVSNFFISNQFTEANDYQQQLPTIADSKDWICRKIDLLASNGNPAKIHWCEYQVFTHEYTSYSQKLYIGYSIITFPKQIVNSDFTNKISQMIDRTDERFRGNITKRIKKDSERPTNVITLQNGDLATFWTSRRTLEDAEFKLNWVKENIG